MAAALSGGGSTARAADYAVKPVVGPPGTVASVADVNPSGEILGTWRRPDGSAQAFVVRGGKRIDLGELDGKSTFAVAISDGGLVLGAYSGGYFLHDDAGLHDLGSLGGLRARDINDSGMIVGAMVTGNLAVPARWNGSLELLPRLNGRNSAAYAINNAGQIVGGGLWGSVTYSQSFAWRYEAGALTPLSGLGGQFSVAYDLNAAGTAVGEARLGNGLSHAFRSSGHLAAVDLGTLPGELTSIATGVNAANDVVGRGSRGGWLHSNGVMTPLTTLAGNPPGWELLDPVGISDDGLIVGNGRLGGESRAFVLGPSGGVPLIFIPGITGSVLERTATHEELWPRSGSLFWPQDDWVLELALRADGSESSSEGAVGATDIVREFDPYGHDLITPPKPIYAPTIAHLEEAGYIEGENLLVFPFDWRKPTSENADALIAFMKSERRCDTCRFDILAHSLGGLVAMSSLRDPQSLGLVRRVVTAGTPVLGSPKALGLIQYRDPCFIEKWGACLLNPENTQRAIENMPGVYELLPSRTFHSAEGSPLRLVESGFQSYSGWTSIVKSDRNGDLVDRADAFHSSGIDDFTPLDPDVRMLRMVGTGKQTFDYLQERKRWVVKCEPPTRTRPGECKRLPVSHYEFAYSDGGDGTVLLNSADLRRCEGSTTAFDNRNGIPNRYFPLEHLELAQDSASLGFALKFFETGESAPLRDCDAPRTLVQSLVAAEESSGSDAPLPVHGVQLEAVGPVVGAVSDFEGRETGWVRRKESSTPMYVNEGTGGYDALAGDDGLGRLATQVFRFEAHGLYLARLSVDGDLPVRLRARWFAGSDLEAVAVFDLRDAKAGMGISLPFSTRSAAGELTLSLDRDGDGTTDETIRPTAVVEGDAPDDEAAPQTTVDGWRDGDTGTIAMEAHDTGGSGVAATFYSIDGAPVQRYTAPFTAPLDSTLMFYSLDSFGNTEDERAVRIGEVADDDAPDRGFAAQPIAVADHLRRALEQHSDADWFSFVADGSSTYRIELAGLTENFNLELYDAQGALVAASTNTGSRSESLRLLLPFGRYGVRVYGEDGAHDARHLYHLKLQIAGA